MGGSQQAKQHAQRALRGGHGVPKTPFDLAVVCVLEIEGVFSDHPNDPGKKTKYGITEAVFLAAKRSLKLGPEQLRALRIEDLTKLEARAIYRLFYWDEAGLDRIAALPHGLWVAIEMFEAGVNCGLQRAARFVQAAYNFCRRPGWSILREDGILGHITLAALEQLLSQGYITALVLAMNGEQYAYYKQLVDLPGDRFEVFSRGWTKRLKALGLED